MDKNFVSDTYGLKGGKALITGGSRGIGRCIAEYMARAGAEVAVVARGPEALGAAAEHLRKTGQPVHTFSADLADPEKADQLFDDVLSVMGGIDFLINNAGTTFRAPAAKYPTVEWERVMNVNVTSLFRLSSRFGACCLKEKKPGKIVNIASLLSEAARPTIPAYTASKGAVRQLTMALAVEWAEHNIQVNAVGPGYIETDMTEPLITDPEFDQWVRSRTPLGRWGRPEDIAAAVLFLASPASDFITGQTLYVDGGWLASL